VLGYCYVNAVLVRLKDSGGSIIWAPEGRYWAHYGAYYRLRYGLVAP